MRAPRALTALCALACLVVLAGPPATAFDQPGCGCGPGEFTTCEKWYASEPKSMTCRFNFEGFPISVFGKTDGGGPVRAWMTLAGNPEVVLLECSDLGQCGNEIHDEGLMPQRPPNVPRPAFDCYVQASGSGIYYCASGRA